MIRSLVALFIGVSTLICCLGATAQPLFTADAIITEGTGLTLSLVIGAIAFVGWGAYQLGLYVMRQDQRIKVLEEALKKRGSVDDDQ